MAKNRKFRILLSVKHPGSGTLKKVLGREFDVVEDNILNQQLLAEEMKKNYDAIIGSVYVPITGDMIRSMSDQVKALATLSVGFDHIDIAAAEERGVKVLNAGVDGICASAYAVAEHAFAILLDVVRRVSWSGNVLGKDPSSWMELSGGEEETLWGKELFGRTLGIIGVGRIGSHIARIGRGFRMEVIGYDPYVDEEKVLERGVKLVKNLDDLLSKSDFIALSPCLTEETRKIIDKQALELTKDSIYIVNVARGAEVEEEAIVEGLRSGKIKGYAADVLTVEPPAEETSPLFNAYMKGEFPGLIITPHMAWLTEKCPDRYATIIANRLKETLAKKTYPHVADYLKT